MPKCPVCQEELNYLHAKQDRVDRFSLDETGEPVYEPYGAFGEHVEASYHCPICDLLLANDQDEAVKILKGEPL